MTRSVQRGWPADRCQLLRLPSTHAHWFATSVTGALATETTYFFLLIINTCIKSIYCARTSCLWKSCECNQVTRVDVYVTSRFICSTNFDVPRYIVTAYNIPIYFFQVLCIFPNGYLKLPCKSEIKSWIDVKDLNGVKVPSFRYFVLRPTLYRNR